MMHDICRSPVSVSSPEALGHWNALVLAFLAHGSETPEHLGRLLKADPQLAMAHAARGLFSLMLGRAEMIPVAREALAAAHKATAARGANRRERAWIAALDHWLDGRPGAAIQSIEDTLDRDPGDTISAKVSHAIRFILGDKDGMRRSIERVLPAHDADHACRGYALGCHAFALEEAGEYAAAETTGREALVHAPDDAWGLHAVAHVYDMTARPSLGIRLIEDHATAWSHCNNFRYHVWWHKALLHLDRGECDVALGLYDSQVRRDKTDDYRDIANATSLLMRLELEGTEVGRRWEELADLAEKRTGDGCLVFADLHYMLALAGAGRDDAQGDMAARFARDAAKPGEMNRRVADPGQAALAGLNAFAEGRYSAAFADLLAARPSMQSIGGSHAQRDVFERITIDAGLRAGQHDKAEQVLKDRLGRRGGHEDRFTATRFARIDGLRRIPAQ
ncbi:tetratricopeptide repeat protein [Sulfitobacter sp. D35]|uniref:tetratricopeptide repeat protein n=1 Tax=Sulfitobacter sp. D35 TaxID=3083252 RepID=UPI00296EAF88|nr:tetratricopeptide repeat protein [Sulfitobacter sp. D35]MDW4499118.1 tetratricopeptide repeat protein [Sulfitobacter sp. D35]